MKEQYATYEISKHVKELGFDEPCSAYYPPDKELFLTIFQMENKNSLYPHLVQSPLWQQIKQWLFEKYKITINVSNISTHIEGYAEWEFETTINDEGGLSIDYLDSFKDPITAEIEGIKKAVEYLYDLYI